MICNFLLMYPIAQEIALQPIHLITGKKKTRPRQYPDTAPAKYSFDETQASRLTGRYSGTKPDCADQRLDDAGIVRRHCLRGVSAFIAHQRDSKSGSHLLEFDQCAAKILGVQKKHRFAVCANAWLTIIT